MSSRLCPAAEEAFHRTARTATDLPEPAKRSSRSDLLAIELNHTTRSVDHSASFPSLGGSRRAAGLSVALRLVFEPSLGRPARR